MQPVPGIDVFLRQYSDYRQARMAMVTNNAALSLSGIPSRLALLQAGYRIVHLFGPEHGIQITGADGEVQADGIDLLTRLPVTSLYARNLQPSAEDLSAADLVLFDIPDVGSRFYTYLWTLTLVMEACAAQGKPLVVLDRPNPIGGSLWQSEGPMLNEASCSSFIGRWSIPIRHSCTLGELALYFRQTRLPGLELKVIPCRGWNREESWLRHPQWFVPTSPAIVNIETACIYPGTAFWEGLNLHDGRGTPWPFRWFGAPWIDDQFYQAVKGQGWPGLSVEPCSFTPVSGKYQHQLCRGGLLHITDESRFRPVATGIALIQLLAALYPHHLEAAPYPTFANPSGNRHLDLLLGIPGAFARITSGENIKTDCREQWQQSVASSLLY
jgi:uncharacterized protein YbbC (DUF1343 family)